MTTVALGESPSHPAAAPNESHGEGHPSLGEVLPLWSGIPFAGILLSIAVIPLIAPSFWHHHFGKVSIFWSLLFSIPFLIAFKGEAWHSLLHIMLIDYIPFIILLWGLFTTAGGIVLRGSLVGTPGVNTLLLIIGTLAASWVGTTGAAMLLIRPVIRANRHRKYIAHTVIFFIFLVANIGGSLTPLGDPPLFLGFLHGVPFFWTTLHLIPITGFVAGIVTIVYFLLDSFLFRKEAPALVTAKTTVREPIRLDGTINILFLLGIITGVLLSGSLKLGTLNILGIHTELQNWMRDAMIISMGLLSMKFTRKVYREANGFTWGPILEVAKLFAGIFITIVPVLAILQSGEKGAMRALIAAVSEPWHYFWMSGILSSFLDNAPTYLTFFNTALGKLHEVEANVRPMLGYADPSLANHTFIRLLTAISCGAVFMGANTYIGNAPNFMVKSIAEENSIRMPSFFGYMAWSIAILIPVFIITTVVFF